MNHPHNAVKLPSKARPFVLFALQAFFTLAALLLAVGGSALAAAPAASEKGPVSNIKAALGVSYTVWATSVVSLK